MACQQGIEKDERECLAPSFPLIGGGLAFLSNLANGMKLAMLRDSVLFSLSLEPLPLAVFLTLRLPSSFLRRASGNVVVKLCSRNEGFECLVESMGVYESYMLAGFWERYCPVVSSNDNVSRA